MTTLHDPPTGGKDPNSPGQLHRRASKHVIEQCAWCKSYLATRKGGFLPSYQFGWQHSGQDEIKWDSHWFCCVAHYRRFHGSERPTGA